MTKLEKIVKAAKALRKKYPNKYSKWTDYIKAASKQVSGFEGVSRKGDKTTVHYSKKGPATKKKAAPKKATQSTLFGVKKAAPKKKAPAGSSHKDTKSHNVNIRVVSGVNNMYTVRDRIEKEIKYQLAMVDSFKLKKKNKTITPAEQKRLLYLPKYIKSLKTQLREQNKHITQSLK